MNLGRRNAEVRPHNMPKTWNALAYVFHCVYPVQTTILTFLTASEAALVASLVSYRFSDAEGRRWLHPIRDLPEHSDWARKMMAEGHAVTLVGKDLDRLVSRIRDPIGFWEKHRGEERFVLWLSVLHMHGSRAWLQGHYAQNPHQHVVMRPDGEVVAVNILSEPYEPFPDTLVTMFIPPPCGVNEYARDSDGLDWYISAVPNRSNVDVLFFLSSHMLNSSTAVCIKPLLDTARGVWAHRFEDVLPNFVPDLAKSVSNTTTPECHAIETLFMSLNSAGNIYRSRCRKDFGTSLWQDRLRIILDLPHVTFNEDGPMLVVPVSFQSMDTLWTTN